MGWIQHSSTCCQVRVGFCVYVLSRQAINPPLPEAPGAGNVYPLLRAPRHFWPEARVSPQLKEGGGMVRQVAKSCMPAPIVGWKKGKRGLLSGLVLFSLVAPPLQPGVVGLYPVRGVWFSNHLLQWEPVVFSILGHNR
jgi:hypothetical protein